MSYIYRLLLIVLVPVYVVALFAVGTVIAWEMWREDWTEVGR